MTQAEHRPLPLPQPESDFYWEKCRQHELWLRKCNDCQKAYFYPRDICPHCFSRKTTWVKASGRGTLYTYAIVYRPPSPAFRDKVPYVVALVELEEGPRMPTNLVGIEPDPAKIKIGMPVMVDFEDVSETISLPVFRPADSA
ncbi:MAG: hypothetical protein C4315_07000 [Chloroflexota bacterium]